MLGSSICGLGSFTWRDEERRVDRDDLVRVVVVLDGLAFDFEAGLAMLRVEVDLVVRFLAAIMIL